MTEKAKSTISMDEIFEKSSELEETVKIYYTQLGCDPKTVKETTIRKNSVCFVIDHEKWFVVGTREEMLKKITLIKDAIQSRIDLLMDCTQHVAKFNFNTQNYDRIILELFFKGRVKKRLLVTYYKNSHEIYNSDGVTVRYAMFVSLVDEIFNRSGGCEGHQREECWTCFMKKMAEKLVKE